MPARTDDNPRDDFAPKSEPTAPNHIADNGPAECPTAAPSGEPAADAAVDFEACVDALAAAEAEKSELAEAQDRLLRLQAELENFRKRSRRAMEEELRYACLPLMRDLLTVLDNLQRAIDATDRLENSAGLLEGVKMLAEQFALVLKQHHCQPIDAQNARFDPHVHEAIAQWPSEEHEPGTVAQVAQVGYLLHGRVIRPSQVIVAAAPAAPVPDTGHGPPDGGEKDSQESSTDE